VALPKSAGVWLSAPIHIDDLPREGRIAFISPMRLLEGAGERAHIPIGIVLQQFVDFGPDVDLRRVLQAAHG